MMIMIIYHIIYNLYCTLSDNEKALVGVKYQSQSLQSGMKNTCFTVAPPSHSRTIWCDTAAVSKVNEQYLEEAAPNNRSLFLNPQQIHSDVAFESWSVCSR